MLKELICAVALSGTIGMTAPQNSNDGTYYQDVTVTESYEYETNEVNSVDDLVVGNIYKVTADLTQYSVNTYLIYSTGIFKLYTTETNIISVTSNEGYTLKLLYIVNDGSVRFYLTTNNYVTIMPESNTITFYALYTDDHNIDRLTYSKSDYLGEKTITVTPKEFNGLFAIFDNFLHERLFSGGILDTTNVTVFNATMSLGQWLSTTTSIVLLSLIVLLLVLLIKFIFKYVGGMMIWRS